MKDLIIVGAGGLGREILQMCMEINKAENRWNIKGFVDDNLRALDGKICKYGIIGSIAEYQPSVNDVFVLAVAEPHIKKTIVDGLLAKGANFEIIISPRAFVADNAKIGKGVVVSNFCFVSDNVVLGDFVFFNSCTTIGHDAVIGDFTSTMAHVDINGQCVVGKGTYWGSGARVMPQVKIGNDVVVGTASVVFGTVRDGCKVFGNPAKKLKL